VVRNPEDGGQTTEDSGPGALELIIDDLRLMIGVEVAWSLCGCRTFPWSHTEPQSHRDWAVFPSALFFVSSCLGVSVLFRLFSFLSAHVILVAAFCPLSSVIWPPFFLGGLGVLGAR
jgi:hypothetical protein